MSDSLSNIRRERMFNEVESTLKMIKETFKDWDERINRGDYHEYKCKNCGYHVKSPHMWVRGQTLCRRCYLS